ncbi:helix-turn-helix domain-containing protein [Streptomyces sp. 110]|uniref:Helix-turn-helix domain-containing protein n=1 Tax=Streptomyces endocoffeicus TaxID=2898945 RepID=A0ABS1PSD5_9ACTN|nr:helix-turn-helix transcriptional regulator [Streptomyces endocoffeicus]MBL1115318.1 helix-turn-helix domain-containing protein [Streptomyces endocoffeicus]
MSEESPAILRRVLGRHLQDLRERTGRSFDEAAAHLGVNHNTVRRLEKGLHKPARSTPWRELLIYYGADDATVNALVELGSRAEQDNWWDEYSDVLSPAMANCVMVEGAADKIRGYVPNEVPALMQTAEYARAAAPVPDCDRWMELLQRRQAVLDDDNGPQLWVTFDQAALLRETGSPGVMEGQLAHLLKLAEQPRITIQVVPFSAGIPHAARAGSCCLYRLRSAELPDIVCVDQLDRMDFVDRQDAVASYTEVLDQTAGQAAARGEETRRLLQKIHDDWRTAT